MGVGDDRPIVTVCGLGPGAPDLLTERTVEILNGPGPRFLRTARHPGAERFAANAVTFDAVYDAAGSFDEVYATITDEIAAAAFEGGRVTYCVPGSPLVLERSVAMLRARDDVEVELVPALSFLDEVWARLGVDPVDDGVRLIDGHRFGVEAAGERGPLLIAHAHAPWVLSDVKLALLAHEQPDDQMIVVLQRLGTADEQVFEVPLVELDRRVEPDHLTSLYLPTVAAPVGRSLLGSVELMMRLRTDCPWDRAQDHASLRKYLIEEAYEVLDVLDRIADLEPDAGPGTRSGQPDEAVVDAFEELESELGDLWLQILFHSRLAEEAGHFDISDVATTLTAKMIGRHPHVFGTDSPTLRSRATGEEATTEVVEARWEQLKAAENLRSSVLDGIPPALPSLARAAKVLKRVTSEHGVPRPGPWLERLTVHAGPPVDTAEIGRLLMAVVELARAAGVDSEQALREALNALTASVREHERATGARAGHADAGLSWVVG